MERAEGGKGVEEEGTVVEEAERENAETSRRRAVLMSYPIPGSGSTDDVSSEKVLY